MILYYTTSAGYDQEQNKVENSLGGYKSSTPVINDDFNNIFGEITPLTIQKNRDEYIAIILKNELGGQANGAEIWIETPEGSYSDMELAVVTTNPDVDGNPKMERVRDTHNKPFIGDFIQTDVGNKALIGDIPDNAELGIWIKRSVNQNACADADGTRYEKDPDNPNIYKDIDLPTEDVFKLNISWV